MGAGGAASSRKGNRRERQLVNETEKHRHLTAMRCPASGAATERDLGDLVISRYDRRASKRLGYRVGRQWAVEVKAESDGKGRLAHEEVFGLCRYALNAGATPLVAVKPNRKPWSFYEPRELTFARKSRGVTQDMLPGRTFEDVFLTEPIIHPEP